MLKKFDIFYKKNDNSEIFRYFNDTEVNKITKLQNYIPIYNKFFSLNNKNFNKINLNQKNSIKKIKLKDKNHDNKFLLTVENEKGEKTLESFFKFSPLLDTTKYMAGKYKDISFNNIKSSLPDISNNSIYERINCYDNSSYVDSFFSYLSSILLNEYNFVHGLDFYGSFLGIKDKFKVDITDDLEYLYDYDFFHEHKNVLFSTDNINEELLDDDTRKNRKAISIKEKMDVTFDEFNNEMFNGVFSELSVENLKTFNSETVNISDIDLTDKNMNYINNNLNHKGTEKTNSECSSRISDTSNEEDSDDDSDEDSGEDSEEDSEDESKIDSDDDSEESNCNVYAEVYNFPCQIICLEKLDKTLDICTEEEEYELSISEWKSCLFQVIMILITYQKVYDFTHNDLHTNNIMYVKTDKKYLNYKYNGIHYRVPTYGKIYKIIDFGRAIYKFKGKQMCSDSFYPKGDAAGQYNFSIIRNANKKEVLPNKAFDLCRLACSLYDYFFDEFDDEKKNSVERLIDEWIKDDNGKNILYKSNGDERYPDFKLYKMISRKCTKETPEAQLEKTMFKKYIISKKKLGKKAKIMNIDKIPELF